MIYEITLYTAGLEFHGKGETILEAMKDLNVTWDKIKAKGVLKVVAGKRKVEHLFPLIQLRKIFVGKGMMMIWSKRLEFLLK